MNTRNVERKIEQLSCLITVDWPTREDGYKRTYGAIRCRMFTQFFFILNTNLSNINFSISLSCLFY